MAWGGNPKTATRVEVKLKQNNLAAFFSFLHSVTNIIKALSTIVIFDYRLVIYQVSGQSYTAFTSVNYDSRAVITSTLHIFTTLDS